MKIQIKNRFDLSVIFECEADSLRIAMELAIKQKADLSMANLSRASLSMADLSRADLSMADLSMADLSRADLYRADLSRADLSGANLSGANLSMADLSRADLSGANLSRADLSGADLSVADLSGAELSGANLSWANLTGEKLDKNPIQLLGLKYSVLITKQQIKIGCEIHKVEEWESFDDRRILEMDGRKSLEWWRIYKPIIMALQKEHLN